MTNTQMQEKLHTQIPLTKLMQLQISEIKDEKLISNAPLDVNINDKGTAFGGSLSTMAIISSWSVVYIVCEKLGFENSDIMIIKNESSFLAPVTKELYCVVEFPSFDEVQILKSKIEKKDSGSIKIKARIIENNRVCLEFMGVFVVKKN